MKLGFIGTGKIASSVIKCICNSNIFFKKIIISPRNKNVAQKEKKRLTKRDQARKRKGRNNHRL